MLQAPISETLNLPPDAGGNVWFLSRPRGNRQPHRHAELELNLVSRGHATYIVGEERFHLTRRTLLWLFPAQNHVLVERSDDFEMWIAVWRPELLTSCCQSETSRPLLAAAPPETWCRRLDETDASELEPLLKELQAARENADLFNAGLAFALLRAFAAWQRGGDNPKKRVHACVEKTVRLLRHLNPPPGVPELAREVGMSASRLSRLFKAQIGVSLSEFRAAQCLERAQTLCEESDLTLLEVAERAGFGSYAQFHRVFGQKLGQSPSQFRRRVNQN